MRVLQARLLQQQEHPGGRRGDRVGRWGVGRDAGEGVEAAGAGRSVALAFAVCLVFTRVPRAHPPVTLKINPTHPLCR